MHGRSSEENIDLRERKEKRKKIGSTSAKRERDGDGAHDNAGTWKGIPVIKHQPHG